MMIAVVGAGGKTTRIHALAEQYLRTGKRVLITTTTHMRREPDCILTEDEAAICQRLNQFGICMAGNAAEDGKICGFSPEFLARIQSAADVVLVEADGSKGLPLKAPLAHEPVIPNGCDAIEVVMGLSAIGKPLAEVTHRLERVQQLTGWTAAHLVTAEDIKFIAMKGYVQPLRAQYPHCTISIQAGQVNTPYEKAVADMLKKEAQLCGRQTSF